MTTAQTQLIAEELCVSVQFVKLVQCDKAVTPDQGSTSGSQSTPTNFNVEDLALARATAREALIAMAASRFGENSASLTVWSVNPDVSVPTVRSLGGVVADSVANRRFEKDLLLLFAVSALLLAGSGVYGVVTYSVVQRQREIGVRLALGAQKTNIYRLVLRDGLTPVVIGTGVGIGLAFLSARVIGNLLFDVSPYNPLVAAAAIYVLVVVGAIACLLPAARAAAVEPIVALRAE
jgi:hypothetical protein